MTDGAQTYAVAYRGIAPDTFTDGVDVVVEGKLDAVIARVPGCKGKVLQGRTSIAPHGFIALIEDTEGNQVGLHSLV